MQQPACAVAPKQSGTRRRTGSLPRARARHSAPPRPSLSQSSMITTSGRPGRSFGFELGVDARLHGVDLIRALAGIGRRGRCSKCHCSESQNTRRDHVNTPRLWRRARWPRARRIFGWLLPFVALHQFVDVSFHGLEIERGRRLHRRVIDRRFCQLRHLLLHEDETPELAGIEVIHIPAA